jgi:LysM domain
MIDYIRTQERKMPAEGTHMTVAGGAHMTVIDVGRRPVRTPDYRSRPRTRVRPPGAAVAYRGTAVPMSHAPHRPRPVSVTTTVLLAAGAALITVWLLALGESRSADTTGTSAPEQVAVVQVQPGENLEHLAARVAPGAPVRRVVDRIRELNGLDSAALDAGQTLIAPVG